MGKVISTVDAAVTSEELRNSGFKIPINIAEDNSKFDASICFECRVSDSGNGVTLCKEAQCPTDLTPDPDPDTDPDTDPDPDTRETPEGRKYTTLNLKLRAKDANLNDQFQKLYQDLRSSNVLVSKLLRVQQTPNPDNAPERIVLWGRDINNRPHMFLVQQNDEGEWGWINHETPSGGEWTEFDAYNKLDESRKKNIDMLKEEYETNSLSQMIDDKLREFNFYSANEKGKQKVVFTDEDREEISKEFDDLIKKYPEDIAFIRAVVVAKGEDKKSGEPIVRLGSYYNNADIELPFNSQMNGLGKLLDGGITYFTIMNNEGPDYRDFKIVGGDNIPEVEFQEKDKEEIEVDTYKQSHDQEMAEMEEPFEEVMKKKEQKGLANLLNKEEVTNELTKKQKEVLENLKKEGYKFKKPEQEDIYSRVRINSKEFNESIKAWKPKKG